MYGAAKVDCLYIETWNTFQNENKPKQNFLVQVKKKIIKSQVYLKTEGQEGPWIPLISIIYPGLNLNIC